MSLIRLANGHKYEIEQPQEGEGMMRNRRRNTVQLTFRAGALTTRRRMNRMNSWPELRIRIFPHTPLWAIGRIKRLRCRKKPAKHRPFMAVSYP